MNLTIADSRLYLHILSLSFVEVDIENTDHIF